MTKNTIFFMCNHEDNPLDVTDWELIVQHIGIRNGVESIMNVYLLHSITYPNPIIYITKRSDVEFRFTYIDIQQCKYVKPVIYDTGLVEDICYLSDDELDILEDALYTNSSLYGSTYNEIFEKTKKYKEKITRDARLEGNAKLLNKIKYTDKSHSWFPCVVKFGLKEEKK